MLADTIKANLQERSHLGEIINVQLDVHLGRSKEHAFKSSFGKGILCKARMVSDDE